MKSIEVKAKTVHEAIADACEQLEVAEDEVTVEILSQGGMFGKAKVLVTIKEGVAAKKEEPKDDVITPKESITLKKEEKNELVKGEKKKELAKPAAEKKPVVTETINKDADADAKFTKTYAFVKTLIELLENDSLVTSEHTDTTFNINVNGENVGRLIGKGGEVLNAIQTLVTSIAISNANGSGRRVMVNVGDYKERRGDSLKTLALKKAELCKISGRFIKLEPMNARDRAIIHTALSEVTGIRTYSTGKDPFRCLCIAPADKQ